MIRTAARRAFATVGLAGVLAFAGAAAAVAQEPDAVVRVFLADSTIAADSAGVVREPNVFATEPVELHDVVVKIDFADVADIAEVTEEVDVSEHCTATGIHELTCTDDLPAFVDSFGSGIGAAGIVISPLDTASDGDEGTLTVTLSAAGIDAVSYQARVRIGEGVDLAAGSGFRTNVAPGAAFDAPFTVTDVGATVVHGATMVFVDDYAFRAGEQFSNCLYAEGHAFSCHFDTELRPGARYQVTVPYVLGADTFAPGFEAGGNIWMTPAEYEDFAIFIRQFGFPLGEPGAGDELALVEAPAVSAQGVQADTEPTNNFASLEVTVTGTNGADLAAIGDTVTGDAGDVVTATVGLRNRGPATLDNSHSGIGITTLHVAVPPGTTAVGVPDTCLPIVGGQADAEHPGQPGHARYVCDTGIFLAAGDAETFDVDLRIDAVIANATGTVRILVPCECEGFPPELDLDASNNQAKILVNPASGGGAGGGLPVTGAATGMIVVAGGLLLVVGVAGYAVARRRRLRFVA